jgi:hypothetical protein
LDNKNNNDNKNKSNVIKTAVLWEMASGGWRQQVLPIH